MQGPKISSYSDCVNCVQSIASQLPHSMNLKKEVELENGTKVQFLMDTGSPVTFIPQSVLAPDTQPRTDKKLCCAGMGKVN